MGFVSSVLGKAGPGQGKTRWREVFSTNKEESARPGRARAPREGGSWAASATGNALALRRFIQAQRSRAPGGWSDDRWEQTLRHYKGIAWLAIHRLMGHMRRAEFQVYIKDKDSEDGQRPVSPDDPPQGDRLCKPYELVDLLQKPNPQDSFGKLMARWVQQKYLTGTALTMMVPNQLGYPMELYCIPTASAIPQPTVNPEFPEGYYRLQPVYPYGPFSTYPSPNAAVGAPLDARWTFKFTFEHPLLRYEGYSPLTGMSLEIDSLESITRSRFHSMKKSVAPSGVLDASEMEGTEQFSDAELERIRAEWAELQGAENHGVLLVPPPGTKYDQFGTSPKEMDWQQSWDQVSGFVMGGFGITKPAAGMVEDSSYSTLFATLKQLSMVTLDPECDEIGSELTRVLAPFFGDNLIVVVRTKPINDHDIVMARIDKLMQGKAITKNELRKACEMPVTREKWGDEIAGTEAPQEQQGQPGAGGGMEAMMAGMGGGEQAAQPGQEGGGEGAEGAAGPGTDLLSSPAAPEEPQAPEAPQVPEPGDDIDAEIDDLLATLDEGEEDGAEEEVREVERARPRAGKLAQGAKGPRKSLPAPRRKSYYQMAREACLNGHH